jgi:hypothetical protein
MAQGGWKCEEGAREWGDLKGKNPVSSFWGRITHPSYVICKDPQGDLYAKYVGLCNGYAYGWYSILVPKDLLNNFKGPISQWVPTRDLIL